MKKEKPNLTEKEKQIREQQHLDKLRQMGFYLGEV